MTDNKLVSLQVERQMAAFCRLPGNYHSLKQGMGLHSPQKPNCAVWVKMLFSPPLLLDVQKCPLSQLINLASVVNCTHQPSLSMVLSIRHSSFSCRGGAGELSEECGAE